VSKVISKGRTVTQVSELDGEERIGELARMIGGGAESATLEAARWLLESARSSSSNGGPEEKKKRRGKGIGKR
jgi:DNA repair protein RecN (Recombination protein N)